MKLPSLYLRFVGSVLSILILFAPHASFLMSSASASTGCNYPGSLDSWTDKTTGNQLTVAEVNQFRCAIEKLEAGPLRPNKGTASAPSYSFQGDTDTGINSLALDEVDIVTAGVTRWRVNSLGHLIAVTDNSFDVGASGANRPRDLFISRDMKVARDLYVADFFELTEITEPAAGAVNTGRLYLKDNGGGRTQLGVRFNTGNSVVLAEETLGVRDQPHPNKRRTTYLASTGTAVTIAGTGDISTATGTPTVQVPDGSNPVLTRYASGAAATNPAGSEGLVNYRTGRNILFQSWVKTATTATVIIWIGVTNQTLATQVATDNPAGNYAAFRYSTVAGDASIKAITKDNSVQTITNTGVAPSTTIGKKFEIEFRDGTPDIVFRIDGVVVATHTTNLPAASTNLRHVVGLSTQAASAANLDVGWIYVESDQ